jgi:ATP-dependent Clp protease adapter protein ClpS
MSSQTQTEETLDLSKFFDNLWVAIVWDDPVNLMNYVTYVFIKLFGFSKEKAHKLMMQVHTEGKAVMGLFSPASTPTQGLTNVTRLSFEYHVKFSRPGRFTGA